MPSTDTRSLFHAIPGFGEGSRFRVKVLEHDRQMPIFTKKDFLFERDNIRIEVCKVWEFKTRTSNGLEYTIWVRFMRRAEDKHVNLDFRIRSSDGQIPNIDDDVGEVWPTRVGQFSSRRQLIFQNRRLDGLLFGDGNDDVEPLTLTFDDTLGLSKWGFMNSRTGSMEHHSSVIFFFLSNCEVNGQAFPRFMIKKNFEALGQEPRTVEDYADPNSEQHYRYFLSYQNTAEGRRAFDAALAGGVTSTGAHERPSALIRVSFLLDNPNADLIREGLLWNSPIQANAYVRELDERAWSYDEVHENVDDICENHVNALTTFKADAWLSGDTKAFVDDELKCDEKWFFEIDKSTHTEERTSAEKSPNKMFGLSVKSILPFETKILEQKPFLKTLFLVLNDPASLPHAPDTSQTVNYFPKRGPIMEDINKSGTVMYWDDDSVMMLSPTPYMARFHFLVWSRYSKFVSPFHYLEESTTAADVLRILDRMKAMVKLVLGKLNNKGVLSEEESTRFELGFHYVGTVPRLHMHVLSGPMTNEAFRKDNARRWVGYDEVYEHWKNLADNAGSGIDVIHE